MTQVRSSQVLSAAGIVALVGCVVSTVTPLVAGASPAFVGSIVTSGLLGVVFVGQSLRVSLAPSVPAATLTTVFGGWFVPAPLLYDVGFLATVGTQFGGLLVAAFGMYVPVAALAGSKRGRSSSIVVAAVGQQFDFDISLGVVVCLFALLCFDRLAPRVTGVAEVTHDVTSP